MPLIIKSHIRGGYRSAAAYLKDQGLNEKIRLVEISDIEAKNLDHAFQNMWAVASNTRVKKPLHHISINPHWGHRLTDEQMLKIAERCEQKYGYQSGEHQRVIIEHIKDGRQHFHVVWNRVNLETRKVIWPGHHWRKSKQVAREMEVELGLGRMVPRRMKRARQVAYKSGRKPRVNGRYQNLRSPNLILHNRPIKHNIIKPLIFRPVGLTPTDKPIVQPKQAFHPAMRMMVGRRKTRDENIPDSDKVIFRRPEWETAEIIAWAIENGRLDVLMQYGFDFSIDTAEL
ncbi:MAG: relaxase/mobilization nuclease domain-containing protein [Alphaproteobacteria bacterium]